MLGNNDHWEESQENNKSNNMTEKMTEAIQTIKDYNRQVAIVLFADTKNFETLISSLISSTPTGELRNSLCDLNILFIRIQESHQEAGKVRRLVTVL